MYTYKTLKSIQEEAEEEQKKEGRHRGKIWRGESFM